jgi:hypothetical protein
MYEDEKYTKLNQTHGQSSEMYNVNQIVYIVTTVLQTISDQLYL